MTTNIEIRKLIVPLLFALGCALLTLAAYRSFGGDFPLTPKGYRVSAQFPAADNLLPKSDVRVSGVPIGRVVAVERRRNNAWVTFEVKPKYAPLRSDVKAITRTKTLLGEAYIELTLGSRDAPALPEGGQIPDRNVRGSVKLDEFLSTFDAHTRANMRDLFAGMARGLGERGVEINESIARAAPATASLATVFRTLDDQRDDLSSAVRNSAGVLSALARRDGDLRAAIASGNRLLHTTAARSRDISATLAALTPFLRESRTTAATITAAGPEIERAAASLLPVAPQVAPTLKTLTADLPDIRSALAELRPAAASARRHLPEAQRIVTAAQRGFEGFYPAAREVIPFMQLAALNRDSIVAFFANIASTTGKYVGPGGIVGSYLTGLPTIWNETIAGWKHKLPTNRQNPYPKSPDALLDSARLGGIKSYDCRHVNNPLILPPTGNGAPPCIEQGPWEFNGVSAYYPRLMPAAP